MKKVFFLLLWMVMFLCHLVSQTSFLKLFNRYELTFQRSVQDIFIEDLNGDKMLDLVVIIKDKDIKKFVFFFQRKNGFLKNPDQVFNIDEQIIVFDFGDISDLYKGKEVVCITKHSVLFYFLENSTFNPKPKELMDVSSIFQAPSEQSPVRFRFIFDLNGDGSDDFLIPEPEHMTLYWNDRKTGFDRHHQIELNARFKFFQGVENIKTFFRYIRIQFPLIYLKDFNGDKKKDIISIFKDEIQVFYQSDTGNFPLKPDFEVDLKTLTEEEREKTLAPMLDTFAIDLNNDGFMDIVVSKSLFKGIRGTQKILIYLNKNGKIGSRPDQVIMNEDSVGPAQILDLNGDNQKDLIVSEIKLGLFRIIRLLLTNRISYNLSIYPGKNGLFGNSPVEKVKSQVSIKYRKAGAIGKESHQFTGDFNGDGLKDLFKSVLKKGYKSQFEIFLGRKSGRNMFSRYASYGYKEDMNLNEAVINDLNNDKKSDILVDLGDKEKKKVVIFLSKQK